MTNQEAARAGAMVARAARVAGEVGRGRRGGPFLLSLARGGRAAAPQDANRCLSAVYHKLRTTATTISVVKLKYQFVFAHTATHYMNMCVTPFQIN